jgi:hypothetical protein
VAKAKRLTDPDAAVPHQKPAGSGHADDRRRPGSTTVPVRSRGSSGRSRSAPG